MRLKVKEHIETARQAGFEQVRIEGDGALVDICRLSCIEQGIHMLPEGAVPVLEVRNLSVILRIESGAQ